MKRRKAMSGVVIAMTIGGFMSTGLSLSAIVEVAQNAFTSGGNLESGNSLSEFESTLANVCGSDTERDQFRMNTFGAGGNYDESFEIKILNTTHYNSSESESGKAFKISDIDGISDCSIRGEDTGKSLMTDVNYVVREDGNNWVTVD